MQAKRWMRVPVDKAVLPDFAKAPMPTTSTFLNLLDAIRKKQISTVTARAGECSRWEKGRSRWWGDGVAAENLNDISLVTLFEAPGLRCLSSGDGEKAVEDAWCWQAGGCGLHADVFKAAHHGSSTSNTRGISGCGAPAGRCGPPAERAILRTSHSEALAAFANVGAQVYRVPIRREQSLRM